MNEIDELWPALSTLMLISAGCAGVISVVILLRKWRFAEFGKNVYPLVSIAKLLSMVGGLLALAISAAGVLWNPDSTAAVLLAGGICGGLLGFAGGILVRRSRKAAGVLMLAGGALGIVTMLGPLLMLIGGVLALVAKKAES